MENKIININCLNRCININIDKSIDYDEDLLRFWLRRFIPGVSFEDNKPNYNIFFRESTINNISCSNNESIVSGNFEPGFESSISKYIQQIMSSLLVKDGNFLINAACVKKNKKAVLIIGDYWQGKSSTAFSLVEKFNYDFVSDNYVIINDNKVIQGTDYISFREENNDIINKIKKDSIVERNNRKFFELNRDDTTCEIQTIITPHINDGDKNIHIVSKEESRWYLYEKFSKLLNEGCILFDGTIPGPILNDDGIAKTILDEVNKLLNHNKLYYLSTSLDNITKYVNNKLMVDGLDYNFAIKLTTLCPGNCTCCKDRKDNFKYKNIKKEFFDINVYRKICHNISKIGGKYVCLSGGEPTIINNLSEYISIAKSEGLNVRLNTSGFGITKEKLEEWVVLGMSQIVLSVYSLDEKMTKETRGNLAMYKKTMAAADIISEIKQKRDFVFIVQSVIMNNNYKEISDILKFAIEHKADMYWPSYLEDAINLEPIRMGKNDIEEFRNTVIPKMIMCIKNNKDYLKGDLDYIYEDIKKLYNKDYDGYIYHDSNVTCPWPGKHFTFYPDGIVDPCPGHEYFKSKYQWEVDYNNIDEFFTKENLEKNMFTQYDYCKYCPQGEHKAIRLTRNLHHEHGKKEEM